METEILPSAKGDVCIDNISFRYVEDKPLIDDFSLDVKSGQNNAIVGPTGCGKTTFINLLMRFYDVDKGSISVDGVDIKTVSITGTEWVETSHGITIKADLKFEDIQSFEDADMLLLPGGMPGSSHLNEHEGVRQALIAQHKAGKRIGAICAAPMVLANTGILDDKKATCYPGFEQYFSDSTEYTATLFQEDGNVITGEGPAATLPYAYKILSYFAGDGITGELQKGMMYTHLMESK